jgi:hypothetical protein
VLCSLGLAELVKKKKFKRAELVEAANQTEAQCRHLIAEIATDTAIS